MNDARKTKSELIEELTALRTRCEQSNVRSSSEQTAPDSTAELARLARAASTGFWVVDTDFIIRVANRVMCELSGQRPEEIIGKKCYDVLPSAACHTEACALRRAFSRGASQEARQAGSPIEALPSDCHVLSSVLADPVGESVGVVGELLPVSAPDTLVQPTSRTACRPPQQRAPSATGARQKPAPPTHDATVGVLSAFETAAHIAQQLAEETATRALAGDLATACEQGRAAAARAFASLQAGAAPAHGNRTTAPEHRLSYKPVVLVVIVEDILRTSIKRSLEARGYSVIAAARCDEARDLLAARARCIDAAVLDVRGCSAGGHAALDELRRIRGQIPFLLVLDRPDRKMQRRIEADPSLRCLHKPIEPGELARQLEDAMRPRPTGTSSHPKAR